MASRIEELKALLQKKLDFDSGKSRVYSTGNELHRAALTALPDLLSMYKAANEYVEAQEKADRFTVTELLGRWNNLRAALKRLEGER